MSAEGSYGERSAEQHNLALHGLKNPNEINDTARTHQLKQQIKVLESNIADFTDKPGQERVLAEYVELKSAAERELKELEGNSSFTLQ